VHHHLDALTDDVGDRDIVVTIVTTYLTELDGRIVAIEQASDADVRRRVAHALKSPSATLGVRAMANLAAAIEDDPADPAVASLVDQLRAVEPNVRAALTAWI
jgi:HPt (histidine-containing phosphotransfer) domain-containing protein